MTTSQLFVARPGGRLAYQEGGQGDPPVLLLHGMACDRAHMMPLLEHLAPQHRSIAFNLRGHGDSELEPTNADFSIDAMCDDIAAVCDALDVDRPVLIGHSLGGSIALAFAAGNPSLVQGVVMLDSGIRPLEQIRADYASFYSALGGADHVDRVQRFVEDRLFSPSDDPELVAGVAAVMTQLPPAVFLGLAHDMVTQFDSYEAALACEVPALIILASQTSFTSGRYLEELGPNWQVARTVGSGHFVQLVVPHQVHAMVDRFLELLPSMEQAS